MPTCSICRRRPRWIGAFAVVWFVAAAPSVSAQTASDSENWPRFRGATSGAIADDAALPETWSRTENVVWNVEVPGQGWSSPIVWDDLIFVTSVLSDEPRQIPDQDLIPEPGQEGAPVTSVDGIATAPPLARPGLRVAGRQLAGGDGQRHAGRSARQPQHSHRLVALAHREEGLTRSRRLILGRAA